MPRNNLSSSQKSSADKKVKVAGPSNQHCHSSYITQPYEWIWIKNKHAVLDAPPASTYVHLLPPLSTYVHLHPPTCTFIHFCPTASTYVHLRPPGSTCVHMCSPASICVHLYTLAYICIHFHPPTSTFVHLHPLSSTCIHMCPPASHASNYIHFCPPASGYLIIWSYQRCVLATFANFCQCLEKFQLMATIFNFLYLLANYFQLWYL